MTRPWILGWPLLIAIFLLTAVSIGFVYLRKERKLRDWVIGLARIPGFVLLWILLFMYLYLIVGRTGFGYPHDEIIPALLSFLITMVLFLCSDWMIHGGIGLRLQGRDVQQLPASLFICKSCTKNRVEWSFSIGHEI